MNISIEELNNFIFREECVHKGSNTDTAMGRQMILDALKTLISNHPVSNMLTEEIEEWELIDVDNQLRNVNEDVDLEILKD